MSFLVTVTAITVAMSAVCFVLSFQSFQKKSRTGRYLGLSSLIAGLVECSYLVSIWSENYFTVSLASSVYFSGISLMLFFSLLFVKCFTGQPGIRGFSRLALGYLIFDVAVLMMNPFYELAVHYVPSQAVFFHYEYEMYPLYYMHLIYTYLLILCILMRVITRLMQVPAGYRKQYLNIIWVILAVVAINAVFLYLPGNLYLEAFDFSIWGYGIAAFFLYWNYFQFANHGMLNHFKQMIFENISQGIVLFSFEDELIMKNARAEKMLNGIVLTEESSLKDFLSSLGLANQEAWKNENYTFQCYMESGQIRTPLRCDYRPLKNRKQEIIGKLFVFSDISLETDILTGFQNWESFERDYEIHLINNPVPTGVVVCDMNALTEINRSLGKNVGDRSITYLSEVMRRVFPPSTYFVRGRDALLIAICSREEEEQMQKYLKLLNQELFQSLEEDSEIQFQFGIQGAVSVTTPENPDIMDAIYMAEKSMRAKKLMDTRSRHSEFLSSLIRALQECDPDTETHVKRTRDIGVSLAERIGLTDEQKSELSLLCLLHDIGKIGIPLDILNKPGKLNNSEWNMMKTHVTKGYHIAISSKELQPLAEEILHHHERWDGKGYPDGLSKETIPLLSRIISIVDAYDAMVHDRVYRPAMSREDAIAELRRCAGTQFDPSITAEFIHMIQKMPLEKQEGSGERNSGSERIFQILQKAGKASAPDESSIYTVKCSRYLLDDKMHFAEVDDQFEALTGYSREDVLGTSVNQLDLIAPEEQTEYLRILNEQLSRRPVAYFEHKLCLKNGSIRYVICCCRQYYDSSVRANRFEVVLSDTADSWAVRTIRKDEHEKAQKRLEQWENK